VFTLVRRVRQRLLYNELLSQELLSQGANASSAALIAFILLLLFGTQVLKWQWAVAMPLVAAGVGIYLACRRRPSLYTVAEDGIANLFSSVKPSRSHPGDRPQSGKDQSAQQQAKGPQSGSQDGEKNIRQAEQLAAMGKISEIIGKRYFEEVRSDSQTRLGTPRSRSFTRSYK
jgi:hypothetical protein